MDYEEFKLKNEYNIQLERKNNNKERIHEIKERRFSQKTEDKLINWVNKFCDFDSLKEIRQYNSVQSIRDAGKTEMEFIWDSATDEDRQRELLIISSAYESNCLMALLSQLK